MCMEFFGMNVVLAMCHVVPALCLELFGQNVAPGRCHVVRAMCMEFSYDFCVIDSIIQIVNSLHRTGVLTDLQKQAAVRSRHFLDNMSEVSYESDNGGMSGSDVCPPTTYTVKRTPDKLGFENMNASLSSWGKVATSNEAADKALLFLLTNHF